MAQDYLLRLNSDGRRIKRSNSLRSNGCEDDRDDRGWTNLHVGARKGDLKEVKRLVDEGMDANVAALGPKSHGLSPLHLAAKGGHIKVMDELVERGANIDARTKGACGCRYVQRSIKSEDGIFDDVNGLVIEKKPFFVIFINSCKREEQKSNQISD